MKKLLACILSMVMLMSCLIGCSTNSSQTNTSSSKSDATADSAKSDESKASAETSEAISLDFFVRQSTYVKSDWNEMDQWKKMEELTGIHINWELVDYTSSQEKRTLTIASGVYPDVFWGADFSNQEFQDYANQGIFVPLEGLIVENAPNILAFLDAYPSVSRSLVLPDGHTYSLPKVSLNENQRIWGKTWYDKNILDNLNTKIPETTEEFLEFLRSVKQNYPDLIPYMSIQNATEDPFLKYTATIGAAYGLFNRGYNSSVLDYDEENNSVRMIATTDRYKEVLQYMNTLYSEGLIIQALDEQNIENLVSYAGSGQLASFMYNHTVPAGDYADNYVAAEAPLKGPYGDQLEVILSSEIQAIPCFMITTANEYPVETIKWLDYLYSEEGEKLFYLGIEGVSYTEDANGELHYTDIITKNPDGLSLDEPISLYSVWPTSSVSCVRQAKYALDHPDGDPKFVAIGKKLAEYQPSELWSGFWYTDEENTELSLITADLLPYIAQARTEFISGKRSFDDWDSYLKDIETMGGARYLEINQAAYERYASK